ATGPRRRATNGMAISRAPETTPRRWRGDLESQSRARRYGPEPRAAQTQATLRQLRHRAFPIAANDPAPSFNPASMTSALRRVISIATRTSQKPPDSHAAKGVAQDRPERSFQVAARPDRRYEPRP